MPRSTRQPGRISSTDSKRSSATSASASFRRTFDEQLNGAIEAVFDSWHSKRAVDYRRFNKIPDDWGTAVNVMEMVFGNMGEDSGTGVAFTRNPNTGERALFGEYLTNAQGEDVVAGIRTPEKIADLGAAPAARSTRSSKRSPNRLERHYRDMQDLEFTVERGKLFMLQTRNAKRSAEAAVRIALDLVDEGLIDKRRAVAMVPASSLDQLFHARIDPNETVEVVCKGLNASPGAAAGQMVFSADDAVTWKENGLKTILVRNETTPDDVHGMIAAEGVLTAKGGATSHAAVVARGMGKPCVAGCEALQIDRAAKTRQPRWKDTSGRRLDHHRRHDGKRRDRRAGADSTAVASCRSGSRPFSRGPTSCAACRCGPTPTRRRTRPRRANSARRASVSAAPSTCSCRQSACRSCTK